MYADPQIGSVHGRWFFVTIGKLYFIYRAEMANKLLISFC